MLTQETEIIEITNDDAYEAKVLASALSSEQIRKRALIDYLGINCARQFLLFKKIKIDNKRSVYKVPFLFEEFRIADLYYGNYRIDVITLFKEKTIKIPKIHVDMEILPHFYLVVQIGSRIKEAKIIGFIEGKNILNCSHDSKFYYPTLDMIFGVERFYNLTKRSIPTKTMLGKHIDCLGLFLKFIDNDLSSVYKRQLIQHLMNCDSCRARFIDVMEFEKLADNIHYYPQLMKKYEDRKNSDISILKDEIDDNEKMSLEEAIKQKDREEIKKEEEQYIQNKEKKQLPFTPPKPENIDIETIYPADENEKNKLKTVQMFDIPKKGNKNVVTKKIISTIFNEMPKIELPALKTMMQAKNKRFILVTITLFLVLGSFALISISGANDVMEQKQQLEEMDEYNKNDYSLEYDLPPANGNARLIPKQNQNSFDDYTINQPISTKPTYSPTISKVAWEAPQTLVQSDAFAKYLKMSGKNIKLNLQNDLLLVNDVPTNKVAIVEVILGSNGNVLKVDTYQTSGSRIVDDTAKKVVTDTIKRMKPPAVKTKEAENSILLKIDLN